MIFKGVTKFKLGIGQYNTNSMGLIFTTLLKSLKSFWFRGRFSLLVTLTLIYKHIISQKEQDSQSASGPFVTNNSIFEIAIYSVPISRVTLVECYALPSNIKASWTRWEVRNFEIKLKKKSSEEFEHKFSMKLERHRRFTWIIWSTSLYERRWQLKRL